MKNHILFFIILSLTFSGAFALETATARHKKDNPSNLHYKGVDYYAGDTIRGYKDYVYLIVGDMGSPLLLGVPHDGVEKGSPEIPETGTTGRDIHTGPFAEAIAMLFEKDTQMKPWVMVNAIHRKRVDPNTYPDKLHERYTDPEAIKTYHSYHELLLLARNTLAKNRQGGNGALFLDIHGHAHRYQQEEAYTSVLTGEETKSRYIFQVDVGYGISNYSLTQDDAYLDHLADSSSIFYLSKAHPDVPFSELIRGANSFGGLLEAEGVIAVPSDKMTHLERDEHLFGSTSNGEPKRRPYFNGGYCTRKYGTIQKGKTIGFDDNIISIQIETPGINVRNNAAIRERSAHQFKEALVNYLNHWMGYSF
ncbi:hypothetical protein [Parapedobacter sp. 10938]|uniref:hypothetical protein n=1 Tax=Parapedobacter flavus TaxID=3110225 RepID=UPI002DBFC942|nr:hypothetical protein [Parapedobacter sp. 10938]MEC3878936.1 hypothetical protein [Parapedobacter sp. 10938]